MTNSGIAPIDPKEIESAEVIDVVNARYLRKGIKHIVNINLKKLPHPTCFSKRLPDTTYRYGKVLE
ncbi:hypothetical protein DXA95_12675 [Odoribacter sp. OF09-27XD]|jgi:hypothetical protein|nr:hypothetical protein DXA95_12675 [Odoribacter sp. OF09-27XD]